MTLRQVLALEMATLLSWNSSPSPPTVLGLVVQADGAHLNASSVSEGTTVYDGDSFSTETGGMLLLRGDAVLLELAEESAMVMQSKANGEQGMEAVLSKGTLIFSTARAGALEVTARGVSVRAIADARTAAQVSITGPKELRIYARRGPLQLAYREDTENIAEGTAYRVILDLPEDDRQKEEAVKAHRRRKAFLLIAILGGAAAGAAMVHESHRPAPLESPDRP